jgi:hypothetical protein
MIPISYSFSFGARARCKFCMSGPKYYCCIISGNINKDILNLINKSINYQSKKWTTRPMADVNYLFVPNKSMKLNYTSVSISYCSVNFRGLKSLKYGIDNKFIFKASYSCDCFKTAWVTREILLLDKNHITQKLSFKSYPAKILII